MFDALIPRVPLRYGKLFWSYAGARILVVVALTMIMSYAEGIGIVLFLPLFSSNGARPTDSVSVTIMHVFETLHVPFTPAGALPIIAIIFVAKGALLYVVSIYQLALTNRTVRLLRRRVLSALGAAEYSHVVGASAGVSVNLVVSEVGRTANGFLHYVRSIPPGLNALVFFLIVLRLDWRLTSVCVLMGLTMVGLLRLSGGVARRYSNIAVQEASGLASLVIQSLHAFKYLRATGVYRRFEARVLASSDRHLNADFKSSAAGTVTLSVSQPLMVLFLTGILYYRVAVQNQPVASLFIVLMYFLRIMTELFSLQTSWQSFCAHMGSIDAVNDTIARTEAQAERRGGAPFAPLARGVRIDRLSFGYDRERLVLRDVDLEIAKRSTVALVGASGSGKSTLADLLMGTLRATSGRVVFDDQDLASMDLDTLRRRVGYVPQDAMLFDDTIANNIALWQDGVTRDQVVAAARRAHCAEFIDAIPAKYDAQVGDRGALLSGGQKQRLAIARELLKQPELLVLDEATSALDSESESAIQRSIDELKGQMTILIIAHRLSTIRSVDRIFVLHEGRVVESGSYDELWKQEGGRFRRMCDLQQLGDDASPGGAS